MLKDQIVPLPDADALRAQQATIAQSAAGVAELEQKASGPVRWRSQNANRPVGIKGHQRGGVCLYACCVIERRAGAGALAAAAYRSGQGLRSGLMLTGGTDQHREGR